MHKKILVILLIIFFVLTGATAAFLLFDSSTNNNFIDADDTNTKGNTTASKNSAITSEENIETDWELILSENNTFVDGGTGHGSDTLTFNIENIQKLNIKMHIISELCVSCGGQGKGEITLAIQTPSGEVVHREVYTASSDLNLIWSIPEKGEWQISIDGIAVGDSYKIGYSARVLVIGLQK